MKREQKQRHSNQTRYDYILFTLFKLSYFSYVIYLVIIWAVLVPLQPLVNWDPFETSLEASKTILFLGFCSFFNGFQHLAVLLFFFWFWKKINCFELLCFWKCGDPRTPADSFYQACPECTCVLETHFKIKVIFFFIDFLLKHKCLDF